MGDRLDIAYMYPFSSEAKLIVAEQPNAISARYLAMSRDHVEAALSSGLRYVPARLTYVKMDYVMTYLYSRMLVSALNSTGMARAYARAEARRSADAAFSQQGGGPIRLGKELGLEVREQDAQEANPDGRRFVVPFAAYVGNAPRMEGSGLVNQRLGGGWIALGAAGLRGLLEAMTEREIMRGLPIRHSDLPKEVIAYARSNRLNVIEREGVVGPRPGERSTGWIERLLRSPIADVRHRTVNLILAPYLTNVRGLGAAEATKLIVEYIERCKQVEPNTKVNERYIAYQCEYAKKRGLRPLSFARAKEMLSGTADIESLSG
jgi:hypothetical protein